MANIVNILGSKETLTPLSDMLQKVVRFENEMYEVNCSLINNNNLFNSCNLR